MKKKLLFLTCLLGLTAISLKAQTVQLYRQSSDATAAATEWTYTTSSGGDKIIYGASLSTSSSNICAPAVRRVQAASFTLNYKSTSIGKIVISANSSGTTSIRTLTSLTVGGVDVTSAVTITSTVNGNSGGGAGFSDCGDITITGLNVLKDATNGKDLVFTFDGNIRLNTINVWSIESLPLDFTLFTAKADAFGKTVTLNWSTTNEINTKNFEIQKRTDATEFVTIGKLASKNTAGNHNYSFEDNNSAAGNSYYRIVQFDNDGASKSSVIVPVTIKGSTQLSIYPNPVSDILNVNYAGVTGLKIFNTSGIVVAQKSVSTGSTSSAIDISALAPGAYMLVSDSGSIKFVKK